MLEGECAPKSAAHTSQDGACVGSGDRKIGVSDDGEVGRILSGEGHCMIVLLDALHDDDIGRGFHRQPERGGGAGLAAGRAA